MLVLKRNRVWYLFADFFLWTHPFVEKTKMFADFVWNISKIKFFFFLRYFQGTNVGQHESRKSIVSNQTLVLQSITRKGSGSYRCIASNIRGKSISDAYYLDVKCEYALFSNFKHVQKFSKKKNNKASLIKSKNISLQKH